MNNFAKLYALYSDDDLARLSEQISSLTEDAKDALAAEIQKRGLTPADLRALWREQSDYAARVDKERQQERREKTRGIGRRIAIRVAAIVVGSLLALAYGLLTQAHRTPPSDPASTSPR